MSRERVAPGKACGAALLIALAAPLPAFAATPPADPKAEARTLYLAAEAAFAEKKYDEAGELYRRANDAYADPIFVFDIAQCHRLAGRAEAAIAGYEEYLRISPDAPNRADVEKLLADLRAAGAAAETGGGAGAAPGARKVAPRAPGGGGGLVVPGLALAVVGGVALGISIYTGARVAAANRVLAANAYGTVDDFVEADAADRRGRAYAAATIALVASGAVLVVGGGALLAAQLASGGGLAGASAAVVPARGGAALVLAGPLPRWLP